MHSQYILDNSIDPGDDLYHHVNNDWLSKNPIPDDEVKWGTFSELREKSLKEVNQLIKDLKEKPGKNEHEQRVLNFFVSGEKRDKYSQNSLDTLQTLIRKIDNIDAKSDIPHVLGWLHKIDVMAFWNLYVDLDDKNAKIQVLRFAQGGLTLPNRDYYLENTRHMQRIRSEYALFAHTLTKSFPLATELYTSAFIVETEIAAHSWTNAQLRDTQKSYNPFNFQTLAKRYPAFNWSSYLEELGVTNKDSLVVNQLDVFEAIFSIIEQKDIDEIRNYLKWKVYMTYAAKVNSVLSDTFFNFFGIVVSGAKKQMPLWKKLIIQADSVVGEELGKLYVARHFPDSSKQEVGTIVERIRSVYADRIRRLSWMNDLTKKKALKKLENMKVLVGYPNSWRDYSRLELDTSNYLKNLISAAEHESDYHLAKVGNPPPQEEWHMTPQTVNAYHDPNRLEIVFPAAILQYPFYNPQSHPAANLAGIGYVIGHELTHGFDDQGSLFDENGELNPWMTKKEINEFNARAQIIIDEADNFEVVPGTHMIGKLVIGEAIADLGGAELAWQALQDGLKNRSIPATDKYGVSAERIFFYALATAERAHERPEIAIEMAKTDPHPDSRFRVNGVVTHMDSFYSVFKVNSTNKLYRNTSQRARIW